MSARMLFHLTEIVECLEHTHVIGSTNFRAIRCGAVGTLAGSICITVTIERTSVAIRTRY